MVPPFGRAVIRRFGANASAMKKMAARNFEDLLQVREAHFLNHVKLTKISAQYRFLKICSRSPITRRFWTSSSPWPIGMQPLSCECTPPLLSRACLSAPPVLAANFVLLLRTRALCLIPENFLRRRQLAVTGKRAKRNQSPLRSASCHGRMPPTRRQ